MQDNVFNKKKSLNIGGRLEVFNVPKVMGILNLTPDSFYDGGQNNAIDSALLKVDELLKNGADIIDMGAASTRPGAEIVGAEEELKRIAPIVSEVARSFPQAILSIDTFESKVARVCIEAGAHIINDVSGYSIDPQMFDTVCDLKVPYVLTHMRGTPQTMQGMTDYDDVTIDVVHELAKKAEQLRLGGVNDIIIDPGFGFAKTTEQNFEVLRNLKQFELLELPLLVGISRKGMIYKSLETTAQEALNGTTVLNTIALERGADILRVHDPKEAKEAIRLIEMLKLA